jgi:hypothetical protein
VVCNIDQPRHDADGNVRSSVKHLKHATPDALKALLDGEALKSVMPHAKIRYRKFRAAFETSLEEVSLNGLEILRDDVPDA